MKKRILFVDDDPLVLQGLQRTLRSLRADWEMHFVEGGAQGLDLLAQTPFEVVVSDMRMPGMNGAEFLNEVKTRHPKSIRLILSGHADKDLILHCVGSAHQYLSKPCDAEALKATLQRASHLDSSMKNEKIQQWVSQMDRLPSIPSVYTEIVEALQDPETTLDQVGLIIARDMGMTAKVLKLVNSAFFGLRRQVSGPAEALGYLGLDTVKSLVLAIHAFSQFEEVDIPGFSLDRIWNHSLETAALAKAIAEAEYAGNQMRDECFVSGMLHDAGKLVLALNFSEPYGEVYRRVESGNASYLEAEQQVFEVNHSDVGGYLLGLWGLPMPVVEAIALHHAPERCPLPAFSPLMAVHVANALMHERSPRLTTHPHPGPNAPYLAAAGMADAVDTWRKLSLESPAQAA